MTWMLQPATELLKCLLEWLLGLSLTGQIRTSHKESPLRSLPKDERILESEQLWKLLMGKQARQDIEWFRKTSR